MKLPIKLSLLLASAAVLGTSAASADDQPLHKRLTAERAQSESTPRTTTVAVYADQSGVGRGATQNQGQEVRFELRATPHGQVYGAYVANE